MAAGQRAVRNGQDEHVARMRQIRTTSDRGVVPVHDALAVYPGTFDPFTPGHRDLVARARVMLERVIVLLAVNADKRPSAQATARAVRYTMPCRQPGAMSRWTPGPA